MSWAAAVTGERIVVPCDVVEPRWGPLGGPSFFEGTKVEQSEAEPSEVQPSEPASLNFPSCLDTCAEPLEHLCRARASSTCVVVS